MIFPATGWPLFLGCSIATALLVAGATSATQAVEAAPPAELAILRRVECFELRRTSDGPALGFASMRRTDSGANVQLEWQVNFPDAELNVWHVETCEAESRRWIWRERQPRNSRTVNAERVGTAVEVTEWGRPCVWRAVLPTFGPCFFPLELEERLRAGAVGSKSIALFDPLSNSVESVRIEVSESGSGAVAGPRNVDLIRADGSLAGSWTFLERELVSFRWQRGGLIAVRIDEQSYASRRFAGRAAKPDAEAEAGH